MTDARRKVGNIEVWAENGAVEWLKATPMQKRNGTRYVHESTFALTIDGARQLGRALIEAAAEAAFQRTEDA